MSLTLLHSSTLYLAGFLMLVAALSDAARLRIPNWTSLALLLLFPVFAATSSPPLPWLQHLGIFALILVGGFGFFVKGWAGAGDIKLLAVIGLWAGPAFCIPFLFITTVTGGVLSLGIGALTLIKQWVSKNVDRSAFLKTPVPYGVAIAVGGLCSLALLSHPDLLSSI